MSAGAHEIQIDRNGLTLESAPGADTKTNAIFPYSLRYCMDDLPGEPRTPFLVSAPSVRTIVRDCLEELVEKVAVCGVNLNSVESGTMYSVAGCFYVRGDVVLDLYLGQRAR